MLSVSLSASGQYQTSVVKGGQIWCSNVSTKGATGATGYNGVDGATGATGATGAKGAAGSPSEFLFTDVDITLPSSSETTVTSVLNTNQVASINVYNLSLPANNIKTLSSNTFSSFVYLPQSSNWFIINPSV